jgi:hypothetical protein
MSIINRVANQRTDRSKGYYFRVFRIAARPLESQENGGDDGNDAQIKCDFPAPSAQKRWKNRGQTQKTQKTPRKTV